MRNNDTSVGEFLLIVESFQYKKEDLKWISANNLKANQSNLIAPI